MKTEKNIDYTEFQSSPWKFIFFVSQQKKWFGVVAILCVILGTLTNVGVNLIVRNTTNAINNFSGDINSIYFLITVFLGIMVLKNIAFRLSAYLALWWITYAEIFSAQISFDYLSLHSARFFSNNLSGKLQSKIYNISSSVERILAMLLWNFLGLALKIIINISIAFWVNFFIGLIFLVFVIIFIIFSFFVSKRIAFLSKKHADRSSNAKGAMVDAISNIMAVKQNTALEKESQNVGYFLGEYRKAHVKVWRYIDTVLLFGNFLLILMLGIILYATIYFWKQGSASAGDVVMIFTMLLMFFGDLEFLSMTLNNFMQKIGYLKEGLETVFVPHEIVDEENAQKVEIENGEIEFKKVTFHYEEDEEKSVFDDLSLKIKPGEKIGLVGESGAGKSTFVSLLMRFIDIEKGKITIDGYDISKIRQNDLRRAIAYVPQEALLFHRSLKENIGYSNPSVSEEGMIVASKRAHALDFIEGLPKKFETLVGERGVKLSGGQKQRVMIARAMLKKSPILVLDEATSALDSKSEKFIQESLEELMKGRTTIVIAHRLSTLKKMDRIIVFEGGKIVEDGSHKELVMKQGKYWELWRHQTAGMA
ncbi:MAG: ABC transporter ATP-binding protein/permease [Candidatus Moranbacteria bacterium]|nr:ABC transporter ATP-binding protein/permease [Candidatus Moranbacteria bacterium]